MVGQAGPAGSLLSREFATELIDDSGVFGSYDSGAARIFLREISTCTPDHCADSVGSEPVDSFERVSFIELIPVGTSPIEIQP